MKGKTGATIMVGVIMAPFVVLLAAVGILLKGFIALHMWRWFVEPYFPSAPHLTFGPMLGICVLVAYLTMNKASDGDEKNEDGWERFGDALASWLNAVFISLVFFLYSYIIHRAMAG